MTMFGQLYNNPMMYTTNGCGFTMSGMQGIDPYGSQALGYNLVMGGLNIIGMALNGSFNSYDSTETTTTTTTVTTPSVDNSTPDGIKKQAKTHLDILNEDGGLYKLEDGSYKNAKIDPSYQQDIDDAQAKVDEVKSKIPGMKADIKAAKAELGEEPKPEDFKKADGTTNDIEAYKKAYLAWDKKNQEIKKQEKELANLETSIEEDGELGKALKEAQDAKKARQTAIDSAIEALDTLKEKYNELLTSGFDGAMDSGDGSGVSRLFSPKKQQVNNFAGIKKDLIAAVKSGDTKKAAELAKQLQEAELPKSSSKAKTQAAIDIATEFLTRNKAILEKISKEETLTAQEKMQLGITE